MSRIVLQRQYFTAAASEIVAHESIAVSIWKSELDVHFLRIKSNKLTLDILPFQGQQIWRAVVGGRNITMKSEVDEPTLTTDYLRNYGAFMVHCGATAMGGPSTKDSHPLHGELPNATYNKAWLETGYDERGIGYVELHGLYKHQVAMKVNYQAHPVIRVSADETTFDVSMTVENKSQVPMDFLYLAHVNFLPVDGSQIVASHKWDSDSVQVRSTFPSHIFVPEETKIMLKDLAENPAKSSIVQNNPMYDPEAVMMIKHLSDGNGYVHTLQVHPDGTSDYLRHEPASAPYAIRCIQITPHHKCVGFLPSTAGVEGYLKEKENNRVIEIPSNGSKTIAFRCGTLDESETQRIVSLIRDSVG